MHKTMPIVADMMNEDKYVTAILGHTWIHRETCDLPLLEKVNCDICSLLYKRTEPLKLIEARIDGLAKETQEIKKRAQTPSDYRVSEESD